MIRVGEPNDYAAEILFYLPQVADPLLPKAGHVFVLGEVRIKLGAVGVWVDVALDRILERGRGWYAIRLTALQRAAATEVAYEAVCDGAQPDRGTEIVGVLAGDIAQGGEGFITFYLPDVDDPIYGDPIEGHAFVLGEVELSLPDDAFGDVAPENIVEFGGGMYGVRISSAQSVKRGKAIVVADVAGAQRASSYRTILGDTLVSPSPIVPTLPPLTSEGLPPVAGDLRLVWSSVSGDADLSRIDLDVDLATDEGLMTAVMLSLFLDRRAEPDDKPPSGDARDRRGWWADQFAAVPGDRYGSRLWLLDRAKRTNETALRAKEFIREALAWMIDDRVAAGIDVTTEVTSTALLYTVGLQRPGRDPVFFRFAHTWDHLQETL